VPRTAARAPPRARPSLAARGSNPLSLFRRRRHDEDGGGDGQSGDRILLVGLGNPGSRYAATRHNVGFEVADALARRWQLPRARKKWAGLVSEGRAGPGGPRVTVLLPQTFMNDSGNSAGPARGSLKVPLERVVVVHDEIDLPFGEVQAKRGGGHAGHNGLKSLGRGFGDPGFWRLRVGVGRPGATDPEIVSAHVLSRFSEPRDEVAALIERAADEAERLIRSLDGGDSGAEPDAEADR
jgi:PTH1 family peptidyl-tRNA hydrolase